MSVTYNSKKTAGSYNKARMMPGNTMKQWMDFLTASVPKNEINKILDLGCGTGRFSFALSEVYKCPVLAIDPSETMLEEGKKVNKTENIFWLKGIAEEIPIDDKSVELLWMSQVFHHIDNIDLAFKEICRVIKKNGYLAIRNGMKEHIDEIIWYDCFLEASEIERNRMLSQKETVRLVAQHNFRICSTVRLYQYFAQSYHEYVDKICGRGLSSLIAISDDAFEKGVERLKKWTKNRPQNEPVYEPVDLLVFRKI